MNRLEQIRNYQGDKRSSEYRELVGTLREDVKFVNELYSPIKWMDVKKLFAITEEWLGLKSKPCRCPGKIKSRIEKFRNQTKDIF